MTNTDSSFQSISWQNDCLRIIDQTFLPKREVYCDLTTVGQVWDAIKKLRVRGAPAIGIAGAYGLYLGIKDFTMDGFDMFYSESQRIANYLDSSRPTAANLSWALDRILKTLYARKNKSVEELKEIVLKTAITIHEEDRRLCKSIGEIGVELVPENSRILTHCNTGGLATAEFGTAFSIIMHAHKAGKVDNVWVDETRPLLQGARLTTWELQKAGIPFTLNIDSAAASLMQQGKIDLVLTGADRITKNGDTANKIGTYGLAVLANAHNIPFYVAAPYSTIDMDLDHGGLIEIEERDENEILRFSETQTTPKKTRVYNPAFDVTPNKLITAIVTEKGIIKPDFEKNLKYFFGFR